MSEKTRSRQGYLSYEKMLDRIKSGDLNAYDLNFTPDTHECYVIDPNLKPWPVKSKVCIYDNIPTAIDQINQDNSSYVGQIIAILIDGKYQGYIVNGTQGDYTVSSLADPNIDIDYNNLNNRPIITKSGTLLSPIIADELADGIYIFNGQYKISQKLETIFTGNASQMFLIETEDEIKYVRKITSKEIISYAIADTVSKDTVITESFLKDNGYATHEDVNKALETLDIFSKKEAESYIANYLENSQTLKDIISDDIDKRIVAITEDDIDQLFL